MSEQTVAQWIIHGVIMAIKRHSIGRHHQHLAIVETDQGTGGRPVLLLQTGNDHVIHAISPAIEVGSIRVRRPGFTNL